MNYDLNKLFSYINLKLQSETFVKNTLQRSTLLKHEIESKMSNLYHRSLEFSTETINIEEYKEFLRHKVVKKRIRTFSSNSYN